MPQTDAIAALKKAAEDLGLRLYIRAEDIVITGPELFVEISFSKTGIQAAHAIIEWWKRRDWVKCPDPECVRGIRILRPEDSKYGVEYFEDCPTCKLHGGEGRVPPDIDIGRANVAAILRTQQIIDDIDINDKE